MSDDIKWCKRHTEMLEQNGIPTGPIVEALIPIVAGQIQRARGISLEQAMKYAADAIKYYGKGEPFCCKLGDEKLKGIVTRVATAYEIKKAIRQSQ